jgi:dihydroorotate dehydrogenase (NAD+) catalytic subunit
MIAGATAVEVGTANFADPRACEQLVESLEKWCSREKVIKISYLHGSLEERS